MEHTIFRCDRWWSQRRELGVALGTCLELENLIVDATIQVKMEQDREVLVRSINKERRGREEYSSE